MVALTALIFTGLYTVMALEAGGSTRRSRLIARGCGLMVLLYALAIAIPLTRDFFALTVPHFAMLATSVCASLVATGALWASGFSLRLTRKPPAEAPNRAARGAR